MVAQPIAQPPGNATSKLRDIQDPLTWVSCFLSFLAAKVDHQLTRDLASYAQIVILLARKHGRRGWLSYDHLFRQQLAAGAITAWADLNPSLMAATVLGAGGDYQGRICSICFASDHYRSDCALSSIEGNRYPQCSNPNQVNDRSSSCKRLYWITDEVCRKFNRSACTLDPCRYTHICSSCQKHGHSTLECPHKTEKPFMIKPGSRT